MIGFHKSTEPFEFDESRWLEHEKPSVLEAFRVLSKEGYYITISGHDYNMRKKRLEKEYEKNTKAPGSGEEQPKEGDLKAATKMFGAQAREIMRLTAENAELRETIDKMKEGNPALKESASQFNAALLDEQAKKIAELTKENVRLERVSKTTTDEFNKLYYRMITKSDKIEALGKEIARLNKIIHKKNLKIDELGKESSRHLEGKIKLFGENLDLEQMLKDKNAVLSDVAEELRLSKIREKNLTEVCQKYMKENEELKNELDVDINWDCDWDDSEAYMTIQINQNSYGRTFQVVQRSNTGNRYNSGSYLSVGTEYLLYVYKNGSYSQQAGPFTVTAPSRPKYTIRYDANGGTGAPSSQTKTYGYTLTLSSTKPTRTGYNFLGWSTSKTATSPTYYAGGSYTANSGATLYAVWDLQSYTVSYNANGGSGVPSSQTKYYGTALKLSTTKPTWQGHTFKEWNTSSSGNGTSYQPGATYSGNAALKLYA